VYNCVVRLASAFQGDGGITAWCKGSSCDLLSTMQSPRRSRVESCSGPINAGRSARLLVCALQQHQIATSTTPLSPVLIDLVDDRAHCPPSRSRSQAQCNL
jgi:hypothetical protein